MKHQWELVGDTDTGLIASFEAMGQRWATRQSDVYMCKRCGQICLAEIGEKPNEAMMAKADLLVSCDDQVIKSVQES
jgi:hypothetical protein